MVSFYTDRHSTAGAVERVKARGLQNTRDDALSNDRVIRYEDVILCHTRTSYET